MDEWKKICVTNDYTVKEVVEVLEGLSERCVLIVDDKYKVQGLMSQGDIIRALSRNISIFSRIEGLYSTSFIYLNERDMKKAFEIFKQRNITMLPIITHDFVLQGVITVREILSNSTMNY